MNTLERSERSWRMCRWIFIVCAAMVVWHHKGAALAQVEISIAPLITGLSEPVDITHAGDGSDRLFIVERAGRIRIWNGNSLLAEPFLDISPLTTTEGERGLLGLAFHPSFSVNGRFFVHYTDLSGNTVLASYSASASPDLADPDSAAILLQTAQPFSNHNGGQIRFGPDGFLYLAIGDGGSGGDPMNNGQNLNTLLGKLLRIDVDGGVPYAIPGSNPFVGRPDTRPEIWAFGLRNPWRFSFDRLTGDLFIADVGQNRFEEVNFQPSSSMGGENYGWRLMEGFACFDPPSGCSDDTSLVRPILEYDRGTGNSVTGGHVYRGTKFPDLEGKYLFGDFVSGRVFIAENGTASPWQIGSTVETSLSISAFGEDEAGEIYLADFSATNGAVHEITAASQLPSSTTPTPAATDADGGGGGCFIHYIIN